MMSLFSTVEWSEKKFEGLEVGVKVLKQRRMRFFAQLTKAINRADSYIQQENSIV